MRVGGFTGRNSQINYYPLRFFASVAPKPPVIRVHRVTANSIALRWTSGDTGNSPIIAYRIKFKITYGEWEEKQVHANE
jgi:hypothetical protein